MKNAFFLTLFLLASKISFSQLISGNLVDDNRKMTSTFNFKIKGNFVGVQYYELAVNIQGKVTGVREEIMEGALTSTPAKVLAQKELKKLTFEECTHCPKFHQVLVKVEFIK